MVLYLFAVGTGLLASILWQKRFNMQLSLQVLTDVTALGSLMFAGGGIGSGVGTLMLVSLATASLVGRGRLVSVSYTHLVATRARYRQLDVWQCSQRTGR